MTLQASYFKATLANVCEKCENWYNNEIDDLEWLHDLNNNFQCPCRAQGTETLTPVDNPSNQQWVADKACKSKGKPLCNKYHKGAYGCIRSQGTSSYGARQQCCYDNSRNLIRPGLPGAGTPDRSGKFWDHQRLDVKPYKWCCIKCNIRKYCNYYINGVRKGDASHCF